MVRFGGESLCFAAILFRLSTFKLPFQVWEFEFTPAGSKFVLSVVGAS